MWFGGLAILGIAVLAVPLMVLLDEICGNNRRRK